MRWIADNAGLLALAALVATSVANHLTAHWSLARSPVVRVIRLVSELLSVLASRDIYREKAGALKWPLTSVPPLQLFPPDAEPEELTTPAETPHAQQAQQHTDGGGV